MEKKAGGMRSKKLPSGKLNQGGLAWGKDYEIHLLEQVSEEAASAESGSSEAKSSRLPVGKEKDRRGKAVFKKGGEKERIVSAKKKKGRRGKKKDSSH